ncbi:unnamed protein product [Arabis nemorensis]|uniref:B3 domain-containing protein n=1 Tax=Arabis nemorensis TaxID=586526 RepID=A0A565C1G2_9BRAS|nr:unnamed protein product [Arabis nemorensis]
MVHGGQVQPEKRSFDILSVATERMVRFFSDKGKGKRSSSEASSEEVEEEMSLRATKSFSLRKRKLAEHASQNQQQNPNRVASSSSSYHVASKRRLVVPNEPVREIEPVREREAPARKRKPVIREVVVRERPEETPEWLVNLMREENGFDAKLIIEKELTATDIAKHQNRLLIPLNMIVEEDFLNEEEMRFITDHRLKRRVKGVDVIFVGFEGQKCELNFRRWDMKSSANYVLISGWHNAATKRKTRSRRVWVSPPDLATRDCDHDDQRRREDPDLYILAMYCD